MEDDLGIPTKSEIKTYNLSQNDTKHFFELINIKEDDFELIYGFEKDNPHCYVKFNKRFSTQHVDLIMKVALKQLQGRINRQKQWIKYNNPTKVMGCD